MRVGLGIAVTTQAINGAKGRINHVWDADVSKLHAVSDERHKFFVFLFQFTKAINAIVDRKPVFACPGHFDIAHLA